MEMIVHMSELWEPEADWVLLNCLWAWREIMVMSIKIRI